MSDPYFGNVVALLHCDGSNASTTFTDVKGHTFTANGNAQISTTQSKFGSASGKFDGTGDSIALSSASDFNLGTGDFTIEAWIYPDSISTYRYIVCKHNTNVVKGFEFGINITTGTLFFDATSDNSSYQVAFNSSSAITLNVWQHIAIVRSGSTWTFYINGVAAGSTTSSITILDNSEYLVVGAADNGTGGTGTAGNGQYSFSGYIDDIRITKGIARYTSN